jgi:hypothetical protein
MEKNKNKNYSFRLAENDGYQYVNLNCQYVTK